MIVIIQSLVAHSYCPISETPPIQVEPYAYVLLVRVYNYYMYVYYLF